MKFLNLLRLRKRRNRNPSDNPKEDATEGSDSSRERIGGIPEVSEREAEEPSERKGETETDLPLVDDCCPICFGEFAVPCRAPCGHWYCADCILQYWNHGAALKPCKCPMCSQLITRLIPGASFDRCQAVEVLENVRKYNRLFVGGIYGLILKVLALPLLIKRVFYEMMDPNAADNHLFKVRLFAILLGVLYSFTPFDFLPIGRRNAIDLFDNLAIALVFTLYMIGLYRRRQRRQIVRQLAAAPLDPS
ncbi:E3 ubiquitin-protein like [Actinidia chinensis var. chinensis]|uniref:E3 ubiquitin-protein like n=1 Tax=Actinidia chinensis var. chinensis TaxID=1590841 RepID=A0A2R6Q6H7_ACTCC|nr:E3 ubiquitin-protein like [Actinidia chinensis var. chinensis]